MRTLEIVRQTSRKELTSDFCTLSGLEGRLDPAFHALGCQVLRCPLGWRFPREFKRIVKSGRYDVVHSHVHYFSGYVLRLAAMAGVRTRVAHFRNTYDGKPATGLRYARNIMFRHWIDRHATHIVAVSRGVMAAAWGLDWQSDSRCEVLYNGLDIEPFKAPRDSIGVRSEFSVPASARLCIHVGRMHKQKNQERVVEIFAAMCDSADLFLLLVGRRDERREWALRDTIRRLGLDERIRITGERSDVPRLLSASDLLIFPSLWEGLPGVVLEARAAGIPVVATDLPGVEEIAGHLDGVRTLSLTRSSQVWAEVALELLDSRTEVKDWAGTPFSLRRCTQQMRKIWLS
jgi:glycosyltransferase involved in cell wall biosynthesis